MSPGGHLVVTTAACAAIHALAGSWTLTAAVGVGGVLIDMDHAIDYVLFERGRRLTPGAFLRHYAEGRARRVVLALHSYELFAILLALGWWTGSVPLLGYLVGALIHLALDVAWNGRLTPHSIVAFYSLGYRAAHRVDAAALLGTPAFAPAGGFWSAFFRGAALAEAPAPASAVTPDRLAAPVPKPFANSPS